MARETLSSSERPQSDEGGPNLTRGPHLTGGALPQPSRVAFVLLHVEGRMVRNKMTSLAQQL